MASARVLELTAGMSVDGWRVDARIAIGGFGTVWKVTHTETASPAALKVLHADMAASEEVTQRFEREARALQLIGCDNVAQLFAVGALPDGRPFQVVEFIDGADLAHRLRERGPLSLAETDEVLRQICHALSEAHAAGIIHRDVKASNVMLGAGSRVVLLDFGIAKFTAPGISPLTASRCAVGTPSCMSPEQIRGERIDGRADVYALGALIHHMLTGEHVFGSAARVTTQYLHLHGRRPRPSDLIDVPPAVDDVVVKAMAKRRGDRFATVNALYEAFHAASAATAGDGGTPQRALAAYVEVDAPVDLMSDPDDALIDDYDEVIPAAVDVLCRRGFELVWAASNAALLLAAVRDASERRRAAAALIDVYRELSARPARHPAVHVGLCASLGDAIIGSDQRAAGPLTDVAAWLPAPPRRGMLAPEAALEGVACEVDQLGKWYRLRGRMTPLVAIADAATLPEACARAAQSMCDALDGDGALLVRHEDDRLTRLLATGSLDRADGRSLADAWELSRDQRRAHVIDFVGRAAIAAPIAAGGRALGVLIVARRGSGGPEAGALDLATAAGRTLGLALARFDSELLRDEFIEHAISAQEEERRAIARELHDGLGQSITALMVGLRSLEELVPDTTPTAAARALTRRLAETALAALEETGRMARGLRPSVLDDVGLVAALERHVADFRRTHSIHVNLHVGGLDRPPRVPSRVETTIYRVVQESLTNVARHASASTAAVILEREPGRIRLIVEDDGRGLDDDALVEATGRWKRLGLGIRERVGLLGGDLTVESSPGQGTALYVQFPLPGG